MIGQKNEASSSPKETVSSENPPITGARQPIETQLVTTASLTGDLVYTFFTYYICTHMDMLLYSYFLHLTSAGRLYVRGPRRYIFLAHP